MSPATGVHPAPADQASRLRTLVGELRRTHPSPSGRTGPSSERSGGPVANLIAVASGKGGVGKTFVSVNLAIALAALGERVVLLDADAGLANADVMMGLTPRQRLDRIIESDGGVHLDQLTIEGPGGVRLVPGSVGRRADAAGGDAEIARKIVQACRGSADGTATLLIDLPAGLSPLVLDILASAAIAVVVATPDPTSMADAYALIKAMITSPSVSPEPGRASPSVVINQAADASEAAAAHGRLSAVAERFLGTRIPSLGWVPSSVAAARSVRTRTPLMIGAMGTPAAACIHEIARAIRVQSRTVVAADFPAQPPPGGLLRAILGRRGGRQPLRDRTHPA